MQNNEFNQLETPNKTFEVYLNVLNNYIERAQNERVRYEYLEIITKRSKNLQTLIEQFYDYSRLNDKSYTLNIISVDLHRLLSDHILNYYGDFEVNGLRVKLDIEDKPLMVKGDFSAISRILNNLTRNAIKYSKDTLHISLKKGKDRAVITFKNSAYPLTEEDVKDLFDRFYMKDYTRNTISSGLGLTIAKMLAEEMGGNMNAQIIGECLEINVVFLTSDNSNMMNDN